MMAKPAYWLVIAAGRDPKKFTQRRAARVYRAMLKALGVDSVLKAIGGQ